ncbi:hypothetical protein AAVH_18032 [Aphelenchoides avenae]|nr:hypothetical protein AAVH_18032 [Aphelenchus avenae]
MLTLVFMLLFVDVVLARRLDQVTVQGHLKCSQGDGPYQLGLMLDKQLIDSMRGHRISERPFQLYIPIEKVDSFKKRLDFKLYIKGPCTSKEPKIVPVHMKGDGAPVIDLGVIDLEK